MDVEKLIDIIVCPLSGQRLAISENLSGHINNNFSEIERQYKNQKLPFAQITAWLFNEDNNIAYPVVRGIPILVAGFALQKGQDNNWQMGDYDMLLNPFDFHGSTDNEWMEHYKNFPFFFKDFKAEYIKSCLKDYDRIIVEFLSARGTEIRKVKKSLKNKDSLFIAVDINFNDLVIAKENGIVALCADAGKDLFKAESIDFAFCNSLHHIPDKANELLHRIYGYLKDGGRFAGVEANGVLAKAAFTLIRIWPKDLLPYFFTEIYKERDLIARWFSQDIRCRLKEASIADYKIRFRGPHVLYQFDK